MTMMDSQRVQAGERERFITRQPPIGEKTIMTVKTLDLRWAPQQQHKKGGRGGEGGEGRVREKVSASKFDVGVDGAKREIEVEKRCGHEFSAEDFFESVIEITFVGTVVIVKYIGMAVCNDDILHRPSRCQHQSKKRVNEPRDSKRRCDMMHGFAWEGRQRPGGVFF